MASSAIRVTMSSFTIINFHKFSCQFLPMGSLATSSISSSKFSTPLRVTCSRTGHDPRAPLRYRFYNDRGRATRFNLSSMLKAIVMVDLVMAPVIY